MATAGVDRLVACGNGHHMIDLDNAVAHLTGYRSVGPALLEFDAIGRMRLLTSPADEMRRHRSSVETTEARAVDDLAAAARDLLGGKQRTGIVGLDDMPRRLAAVAAGNSSTASRSRSTKRSSPRPPPRPTTRSPPPAVRLRSPSRAIKQLARNRPAGHARMRPRGRAQLVHARARRQRQLPDAQLRSAPGRGDAVERAADRSGRPAAVRAVAQREGPVHADLPDGFDRRAAGWRRRRNIRCWSLR